MSPNSEAKAQVGPRTPSAECWQEPGRSPGENGHLPGWPAPPMLSEGLRACPPHPAWEGMGETSYRSTPSTLATPSEECFPLSPINSLPSPWVAWTWLSATRLQSCTRVQQLSSHGPHGTHCPQNYDKPKHTFSPEHSQYWCGPVPTFLSHPQPLALTCLSPRAAQAPPAPATLPS